jgi:hypothetical protein
METGLTPDNLETFLPFVLKAMQSGQWAVVAAVALITGVWAVRKYVGPKYPFLATGTGGLVLNLLGSFGSGLLTAATGVPFTWALVWSVVVSVLGTYGWSLLKLLPVFSRGSADDAEAKAKAAGLAAANVIVAKQPSSDQIANGP